MRVIAGRLSGRQFLSPRGHRTHPMSDKIRGALFNALGDIDGLTVLDAFGGSGALSFEAVSRGASRVITIDNDRNAQSAIADNINSLGLTGLVKLIKASANAWLGTTNQTFDLVLLDPPYDAVQAESLLQLAKRVKVNGLVVLSLPPKQEPALSADFELILRKDYGDAQLVFYRRIS